MHYSCLMNSARGASIKNKIKKTKMQMREFSSVSKRYLVCV